MTRPICGTCGGPMERQWWGGGHTTWQCRAAKAAWRALRRQLVAAAEDEAERAIGKDHLRYVDTFQPKVRADG